MQLLAWVMKSFLNTSTFSFVWFWVWYNVYYRDEVWGWVCAFTKWSNASYSYLDGKETNAVTVEEHDVHFEICSRVWAAFINCAPSLSEKDADVKGWVLGFGEPLRAGKEAESTLGNLMTWEKGAEDCREQALLCPQRMFLLVGFWFCSGKWSLSACFK